MPRDRLTHLLTMRMAPTEHAMLDRLATAKHITMAEWVRQQIRARYARTFGDDPPPMPKRPRR